MRNYQTDKNLYSTEKDISEEESKDPSESILSIIDKSCASDIKNSQQP